MLWKVTMKRGDMFYEIPRKQNVYLSAVGKGYAKAEKKSGNIEFR